MKIQVGKPRRMWATATQRPDGAFSTVCVWGLRKRDCIPDDDEAVVEVEVTVRRVAVRPGWHEQSIRRKAARE